MRPEIETYIAENLPTVARCGNGWPPKLVCDWLRQTMFEGELHRYTDRDLYRIVYATLGKLRRQGRIDAAIGIGDNGRETLTYNKLGN